MAVPRPVLLALLGLALCAAAFMATRGAREPGGDSVAVAPVTPAPAVHKAAPAKAKPAKPQPGKPAAKPHRSAAQLRAIQVTKALGRGDAVVFFFTRPGAADDTGTRGAVNSARGRPHVMVVR